MANIEFKSYDSSKLRLLAVDDNQVNLVILRKTLSDFFEIITFDDPRELVSGLDNMNEGILKLMKWPHVFLLDYEMPKMNGDELAMIIRSHGFLQPIFCYSATPDEANQSNYRNLFEDVLYKSPLQGLKDREKLAQTLIEPVERYRRFGRM